jgi:hypothetical protein
MPARHPTLVFVAGPQKGQQLELSAPEAVLGRGGDADIMLSEEYVSRRQARYELLRAGPTLENLSSRGTHINGKRYKQGQKVLLDTGDVIGFGAETEAVFVAAGDDPDAAAAAWETSGQSAFGAKRQPAGQAEPQMVEMVEETPEEPDHPRAAQGRRPMEMTTAERVDSEAKAKRRKLMVGLGIYLGLIVIVGIVLAMFTGDGPGESPMPPMMEPDRIAEVIRQPVERSPNPVRKEEKLEEALKLYQAGFSNPDNLFPCLMAFKESLAYGGRPIFDDPEVRNKYEKVRQRLTRIVQEEYRLAIRKERQKRWREAEQAFDRVLDLVGGGHPRNAIYENAKDHYVRVKQKRRQLEQEQRNKGPLL